ncbi:DUF5129 domain-containing protein [Arthrobacter sp. Marseille-P9274]|uniref:DUF5129 domain-containing protein n=1 Tax=Arthrobacter sp. Marseille-P9274 TaxID=2866572 RepID=UPI0021C6902E|nr:DUF5129 domain-containing protein [Arthrobacter sp. Marseille-P9274]
MRTLLGTLVLAVAALLAPAAAALADTPTDVVVEDKAGVLDLNTLRPAVEDIEFYEPTKVAIYTYRGSASDNLNEEVLRFACSEHPEWISQDGQKWADGLYIFALDPEGRQVGTYMGEDRKVSLDQQADIQDVTKDLFREAQWTDGTIAGVRRGAELINRPWYRSGWFIGGSIAAGVVALGGAGTWIGVRRRNRARGRSERERGNRSYANVTMDLEATEVNARTIPPSSEFGALVLEKYRGFMARYKDVSKLNQQVHSLADRDFSSGKNVRLAAQYADAAAELDTLDDVIADSNTFLNLASGWPRAWDRQLSPLRDDLDSLDQMLTGPKAAGKSATAAALLSFRDATRDDFQRWAAELESGTTTPDTALRGLRTVREEFTDLLRQHSKTVIDESAKNQKEADLMRHDMDTEFSRGGRSRSSILDSVYPASLFYSVSSFNTGFSAGQTSIESARSESSSTGYGSSGGSFSGSGSSSSF